MEWWQSLFRFLGLFLRPVGSGGCGAVLSQADSGSSEDFGPPTLKSPRVPAAGVSLPDQSGLNHLAPLGLQATATLPLLCPLLAAAAGLPDAMLASVTVTGRAGSGTAAEPEAVEGEPHAGSS